MGREYSGFYDRTHPLSCKSGYVGEHVDALFQFIGPGPHPCHWCGRMVNWRRLDEHGEHLRLHVDHINDQRKDNRISNLVPSCFRCNVSRNNKRLFQPGEPWIQRSKTKRSRFYMRTCERCEKPYKAPVYVKSRDQHGGKFCSPECYNHKPTDMPGPIMSITCADGKKRRGAYMTCPECGSEFIRLLKDLRGRSISFCSHSCQIRNRHRINRMDRN